MFTARIRMPRMGTSVHESTVIEWKKSVGEPISKGEVLLTAESDKVEFEIEAPASGRVKEILVGAEKTVPVGEVLALLETEEAVAEETGGEAAGPPAGGEWAAPVAPLPRRERPPATAEPARPGPAKTGNARLTPRVQRLAARHGLSLDALSRIQGTGAGGRVTARDIERHLESGGAPPPPAAAGETILPPRFTPLAASDPEGRREWTEPFGRRRRRIAENLARSAREIPQVTTYLEVDMSRIAAWRESNREAFRENHGVRLTYTPLFLLGLLEALREPRNARFNATYEDDGLRVKRYANIGVAVDTEEGLIVPVVKNADRLSFAELVLRVEALAARAREGTLEPADVQDGTVTLTNFGAAGALFGNPLLRPPEVAIVGTGAVVRRPVALAGEAVAVRPVMGLSVTFDHRANDGFAAGRFAASIRDALERMDLSALPL